MANTTIASNFFNEFFSVSLYKRTQGRLTRQLTMLAIIGVTLCGCYSLSVSWLEFYEQQAVRVGIPVAIAVVLSWLAFRLVNYPAFAEFLIAVQAEVSKVNWPNPGELKRATIVVVCTMFFLGIVLFAYDLIWYQLLTLLGVLKV